MSKEDLSMAIWKKILLQLGKVDEHTLTKYWKSPDLNWVFKPETGKKIQFFTNMKEELISKVIGF